jgi:hypothetical protein
MSIILRVDGLLGKMTGTVYGGQVKFAAFMPPTVWFNRTYGALTPIKSMEFNFVSHVHGK